MTSHHRQKAQEQEEIVCEYLDNPASKVRRSSEIEGKIAQEIQEKFGPIHTAEHIGNDYSSIGDIHIQGPENSHYIELKVLEEKEDFGTLANISPQTPIKTGLFEGDPMVWADFLDLHNHAENVIEKLRGFPQYPTHVTEKCTTEKQTKEHLGRYIRDLINDNERKDFNKQEALELNPSYSFEELKKYAEAIKSEISDYDESVKKKYLKYLSTFPVDHNNLKAFFTILIAGYHKKKHILNHMSTVKNLKKEYNFNDVGELFENYEVMYAHHDKETVKVNQAQRGKTIEYLNEIPAQNFDIQFGGGGKTVSQTNIKLGITQNGEFTSLILFALHWGNVFQGIKTRRFNCSVQPSLEKITKEENLQST